MRLHIINWAVVRMQRYKICKAFRIALAAVIRKSFNNVVVIASTDD